MAAYDFRCDEDGTFEVHAPMGAVKATQPCPACGGDARRLFAAPALGLADRRVGAVIDRAERSRTEPEVVATPPPSRRTARVAAPNPALRRLPRP